MKRITTVLIVASLTFYSFIGCEKPSTTGNEDKKTQNTEYITITLKTKIKANEPILVGYEIKEVSLRYIEKDVREEEECLIVRNIDKLFIGVDKSLAREPSQYKYLCSNIDKNEDNNCKGSYNIVSKANELALESTRLNESVACREFYPVVTITLKEDNKKKVEIKYRRYSSATRTFHLESKGSCVKLGSFDVDAISLVGEGSFKSFCGFESGRNCSDYGEYYKKDQNFGLEVVKKEGSSNPDDIELKITEYNPSKNCVSLLPFSM